MEVGTKILCDDFMYIVIPEQLVQWKKLRLGADSLAQCLQPSRHLFRLKLHY